MPFTFAHPVVALPLKYLPQKYISITGVVIGSLLPDFEYYLHMRMYSKFGHTLHGLIWFCLPLGILLCFLFHNIARNSLVDNLPAALAGRLSRFKNFEWNGYFTRNWRVVIFSLFIGAASHIFWDGFTHETGYFVHLFPALADDVAGTGIPVFKLIQHGSTFLGLGLLTLIVYRMPTEKRSVSSGGKRYKAVFVSLVMAIVAARLLSGLNLKAYGNVIVTVISAVMIAMVITPLIIYKKR